MGVTATIRSSGDKIDTDIYRSVFVQGAWNQGKVIESAKLEDGTEINFRVLPQGREPYNKDVIIPYINTRKLINTLPHVRPYVILIRRGRLYLYHRK